jgi:hypothetical protein
MKGMMIMKEEKIKPWAIGQYLISEEQVKKAIEIGLNKDVVYQRIWKCKWSVEKALTTPLNHKKLITPEQYAIGESNGINRITIATRFYRSKWPIERAITEPVKERGAKAEKVEKPKSAHGEIEVSYMPLDELKAKYGEDAGKNYGKKLVYEHEKNDGRRPNWMNFTEKRKKRSATL